MQEFHSPHCDTLICYDVFNNHAATPGFPFAPSSIYSFSIGHILVHEFCHLGCWAVLWKISETTKILLKYATFGGGFLMFHGQKIKNMIK